MENNTTPEAIPTTKSGFPVQECTRCHGSGKHSYNDVHLDTCYGCGGSGWKVIKSAQPAYNEYRAAVRKSKECTYGDVVQGDRVAHEGVWREVDGIAVTPVVRGRSGVCSQETGQMEMVPSAFKVWVTIKEMTKKDGTHLPSETFEACTATCVRRRGATVDPAPFIAMIPKPRNPRAKK